MPEMSAKKTLAYTAANGRFEPEADGVVGNRYPHPKGRSHLEDFCSEQECCRKRDRACKFSEKRYAALFCCAPSCLKKDQDVRNLIGIFFFVAWLVAVPTVVMAQMATVSVTVTFRERIALPPGASVDIQIVDFAEMVRSVGPIASQRFAITTVPLTVSLTYDPQIVKDGFRYGILATIRAPNGQKMFFGTEPLDDLGGSNLAVDMVLKMLPEPDGNTAVSRRISGVPWTVTEIFGERWQNEDPATLMIDDEMNFAIFGGCNRYTGKLAPLGRGLAFPENMAGTMMACPGEIEALERRFLTAIMQVSDYVRYGAGLLMMDADGRAVLHFVETPE